MVTPTGRAYCSEDCRDLDAEDRAVVALARRAREASAEAARIERMLLAATDETQSQLLANELHLALMRERQARAAADAAWTAHNIEETP